MGIATTFSNAVFEVQQLRNGDWNCVSAHSSRAEAVDEANAIVEQNQHVQARVVQEAFHDTSNRYVTKVIFRSQLPVEQRKLQETPQQEAFSRLSERAKRRRQKEKQQLAEQAARQQAVRRNLVHYAKLVLLLALIGGGGAAALYALNAFR